MIQDLSRFLAALSLRIPAPLWVRSAATRPRKQRHMRPNAIPGPRAGIVQHAAVPATGPQSRLLPQPARTRFRRMSRAAPAPHARKPRSCPFCLASLTREVLSVLGVSLTNSSKSMTSANARDRRCSGLQQRAVRYGPESDQPVRAPFLSLSARLKICLISLSVTNVKPSACRASLTSSLSSVPLPSLSLRDDTTVRTSISE